MNKQLRFTTNDGKETVSGMLGDGSTKSQVSDHR